MAAGGMGELVPCGGVVAALGVAAFFMGDGAGAGEEADSDGALAYLGCLAGALKGGDLETGVPVGPGAGVGAALGTPGGRTAAGGDFFAAETGAATVVAFLCAGAGFRTVLAAGRLATGWAAAGMDAFLFLLARDTSPTDSSLKSSSKAIGLP